jgi:antagonist of KipI
MDPFAHRLANALVANTRDCATLEVTLTGPTLVFHDARSFAVAGADFELLLDDDRVPMRTRVDARAGSVLRFGVRQAGARAYLAVTGGFDVPLVLGSRATHVPSGMGGWQGRALRRGDRVPLAASRTLTASSLLDVNPGEARLTGRVVPSATRASAASTSIMERSGFVDAVTGVDARPPVVRVLSGPQDDRFAADAFDIFTRSTYVLDASSNRMGYRLVGPSLRHLERADIISDATPLGTVQVPASGQPVLLMADRQTTGGYAKLATVISADIGIAGQVAPGESLTFARCSRAEALAALVARERPLLALERSA